MASLSALYAVTVPRIGSTGPIFTCANTSVPTDAAYINKIVLFTTYAPTAYNLSIFIFEDIKILYFYI